MREFNDEVKRTLAETRISVVETAYNHITTAVHLFKKGAYSQACFLAITAIEEMGKARTLQIVQHDISRDNEPIEIDAKAIEGFLREHRLKATRAAASALSVNHGALRRHGRHDEADLNMTSGILFLTKSKQWMKIRNSCIYSDVDIHSKQIGRPTESISGDHAYYFICMGLEVLSIESDAGFGSPAEEFSADSKVTDFQTANEFEDAMISLLSRFISNYNSDFDESNLNFFTEHPQYDSVRENIREREITMDEDRRKELKGTFSTFIEDNSNEPSDNKKAELPEGISYDSYQDAIMEDMVDIGMDMPHLFGPRIHPDLQELRDHVYEYMEFDE